MDEWEEENVIKCNISPDEGKLFSVHTGIQSQTGVLSKGRNDQAEHQSDTHKHRRQNNLKNKRMYNIYYILQHQIEQTESSCGLLCLWLKVS